MSSTMPATLSRRPFSSRVDSAWIWIQRVEPSAVTMRMSSAWPGGSRPCTNREVISFTRSRSAGWVIGQASEAASS